MTTNLTYISVDNMAYQDEDYMESGSDGASAVSAGTRIAKKLQHDILTHKLKPRERLIERDLVKQFSLSRSPVREALARLEGIGLITSAGKRGYIVRDFTTKEVLDLYYLREVLERAAVPLVIKNITDARIENVARINERFRQAFVDRDLDKMIEFNSAFHKEVLTACGNEFLIENIESVRTKVFCCRYSLFIAWPVSESSVTDHIQMLDALAARDAARYEEVVISHMSAGKEKYLELAAIGV